MGAILQGIDIKEHSALRNHAVGGRIGHKQPRGSLFLFVENESVKIGRNLFEGAQIVFYVCDIVQSVFRKKNGKFRRRA